MSYIDFIYKSSKVLKKEKRKKKKEKEIMNGNHCDQKLEGTMFNISINNN